MSGKSAGGDHHHHHHHHHQKKLEWDDDDMKDWGKQNKPREMLDHYRYFYYKDVVEEIYQKIPECPTSLWLSEGRVHFRTGHYDRAEVCFTRVLAQSTKNIEALVYRSQCYCRLKKYTLAMADAMTAWSLDPKDHNAVHQKAEIYFEAGYLEFAYLTYLHGLQNYECSYNAGFKLGMYKCKTAILNCIGPGSNLNIREKDIENVEIALGLRKKPRSPGREHLPSFIEGIPDTWNEQLKIFLKATDKDRPRPLEKFVLKKDYAARMMFGSAALHKELLQAMISVLDKDLERNPSASTTIKTDVLLKDFVKCLDFINSRQHYWQRLEPIHAMNSYQK